MSTHDFLTYLNNIIKDFENKKANSKINDRSLGVIYTPEFIVDYIFSNVFKLYFEDFFKNAKTSENNSSFEFMLQDLSENHYLKKKFLKKLENIKILDPACGSGRFIISSAKNLYQFYKILDSGLDDYEIKRKILQENLYGIEIEKFAYIITKLRLISWLISGNETKHSLPDFNIKRLSLEKIDKFINRIDVKLNIFNLDFLLELESGMFDIIIGNPPYVENKKLDTEYKSKLYERFMSAYKLFDLSVVFIEKSIELLKENGYLSLILPNKFLSADYGIKIREILIENIELREIDNSSSLSIFQKAATYPIIIYFKKSNPDDMFEINIRKFDDLDDLLTFNRTKLIKLPQKLIKILPSYVIPISGNIDLIEYLYNKFKLVKDTFRDLKIIYRPYGFLKYSKFFDNISEKSQSDKDLLLIGTGNIGKYHIKFDRRIKIAKRDIGISYFNYDHTFKPIWQELNNEKIIFREIAKDLTCSYDSGIFTNITGLYFIRIPSVNTEILYCLLTILNSNLLDTVFKTLFSSLHMAGGYLRFNGSFIKRLPLPNKFPSFLSQLGKILQLLSQLKYDFDSTAPKIVGNPIIEKFNHKSYDEIVRYLTFFKRLSNSLVNLLFLDEFYLKSNLDYNLLRDLLDLKIEPYKVPYKFLIPRFYIKNYKIFSLDELDSVLSKIKRLYTRLQNIKGLKNQLNNLMKNNFK
ncbi:MAG: class I SAM-dependent DNA methyltransferase [Candidatus Hodarchaeota archaeon]